MSESGPYLGSKISLISQARIRYEGLLHSINPEESTVTLAEVRSFGTEGRDALRHVPPGDEIYSLIIFKAGDIKDLHVCELPKQCSHIAQDPAVLQHSGSVRSSSSGFQQQGPPFSGTQGQYGNYSGMSYNQFGHVGSGVMPGQMWGQASHPPPGLGRATPPPMTRRSPTMEQGVQASGPVSPQKDSKAPAKPPAPAAEKSQTQRPNKEDQGLPQRTQQPRRRGSREEKAGQRKEVPRQENKERKTAPDSNRDGRGEHPERGERQERGDRGDRDKGGRGSQQGSRQQNWQGFQNRRGRGRGPRSPVVKEKVGNDFDFTAAQFDKNTLVEEFKEKLKIDGSTVNGDVVKGTEDSGNETQPSDAPEEEEAVYYDSNKSFFDNISCDSVNRGQRPNWKEERKMNCETFGIAYARNRGRGGYRGGYYRGGYRGSNYQGGRGQGRGGGRSYRSNRSRGGWKSQGWNDYPLDSQQKAETVTVKTEKTAEATA
ncbi:protein LSM14 homolog A-like isoform X2 [Patiria miniata]|uniref:Uncharacterized protein n=1 Tax=Patiria miniata TaxID=46514 RepID=A0A914B3A2_PATMI|nr:protein LSM14 homolog A-like isoform X2 [Patiria miniata]